MHHCTITESVALTLWWGADDAPLGLIADRTRRVLAGAWAVAPLASEWIHQAALAIRAQLSIEVLLDQVAQFPAYCEAYLAALEQLAF